MVRGMHLLGMGSYSLGYPGIFAMEYWDSLLGRVGFLKVFGGSVEPVFPKKDGLYSGKIGGYKTR